MIYLSCMERNFSPDFSFDSFYNLIIINMERNGYCPCDAWELFELLNICTVLKSWFILYISLKMNCFFPFHFSNI
jgi:hypothetical protein